jgi:hypothetical protein
MPAAANSIALRSVVSTTDDNRPPASTATHIVLALLSTRPLVFTSARTAAAAATPRRPRQQNVDFIDDASFVHEQIERM